ncbi:hypothetical protein BOX15_Mlig023809g2 [Macrostomum lignano]|uniref:ABC transporter domain-containing protein n=1 Tax=Macrostomum lignano TaxID=282301 RepID=A0A267FPH6_9PLAT|nr:hypothetical protein BOX15_Mlig023809g2 [Macrostomum lignano]
MPATLSKYLFSPQFSALASTGMIGLYFANQILSARRRRRNEKSLQELDAVLAAGANDPRKASEGRAAKAYVDAEFFSRLSRLLKILVPRLFSPETFYLLLVAACLVARTYLDVWMIANGTMIESAIIGRSLSLFKTYLFRFILMMPSMSLINNFLKLGLSEVKLRFRHRLTVHLINKWMRGFTYYQLGNLDSRIANPDQLIAQDVDKLCECVADLYSNLSKPILDIVIYALKLTSTIGGHAPACMIGYLVLTGLVLTRLRRPLGRMTVREQQLEGEFRYVNSRVIAAAEEVAFYRGQSAERSTLLKAFSLLVDHLRVCINFRFQTGLLDNILAKYVATVVGYLVVSWPFLNLANPRYSTSSHAELLEEYYQSGRMLVRMAEAVGRVVLSGRELTRLAGFTARIHELDTVLDEVSKGQFQRAAVRTGSPAVASVAAAAAAAASANGDSTSEQAKPAGIPVSSSSANLLLNTFGQVVVADHIIKFEDVPLVTPTGDVLVARLNLEVRSGTNVIVCGPNGCGKSSLFRILGGLWPVRGGRLTKPADGKLFYIPQKPYMPLGKLRDQVIYPDTIEDMRRKRLTDERLSELLGHVQLGHILTREGGWDAIADWADVLSGGEKQRMAMARLFYHAPQFAILDECTSAVSVDVEAELYSYCRKNNITLFTVSHRKSLWQHHEFFMHMDGRGEFKFGPITDNTEEFGS